MPIFANPNSNRIFDHNLKNYRIVLALTSGRISGVDIFSVELVRELQRRGFAAEIVQTAPGEHTPDPLPLPADIPVQALPLPKRASWQQRWQIMREYLEERAPCIYLPNYDWRYSSISPTLSANVKVIGIAHSDDPVHYEHVARLGRYWDAIVAVSRAIADRVKQLSPDLIDRLSVIPYGVRAPLELPERQYVPVMMGEQPPLQIVYAGRLSQYQKQVLDLPRIAAVLQARGIPFEMTIIGSGLDEAALRRASESLTKLQRVRLLGSLAQADVLRIFEESDVFILTSSFEGLPVSLLEAMAHGCVPVVTRLHSGIPEILEDGVNGFAVPVGAIEQFADRLQQLQQDVVLRHSLAMNAHRTIFTGGYRLEDMTENYLNLFQRVITQAYQRPAGKILPPPEMKKLNFQIANLPWPLSGMVWHTRRLAKAARVKISRSRDQ